MDTKYSLTTLLNDLLKLQNNGYQIITKLSDVVSSNADTVEIDVADSNGVIQKVYVPSFGSLKQQIVHSVFPYVPPKVTDAVPQPKL